MENKGLQLTYNINNCPKSDIIIYAGLCKNCKYYKGFELYKEQQTILCSYNIKIKEAMD